MFGWSLTLPSAWISWVKVSRRWGWTVSSLRILSATGRPVSISVARYTVANAPAADLLEIGVAGEDVGGGRNRTLASEHGDEATPAVLAGGRPRPAGTGPDRQQSPGSLGSFEPAVDVRRRARCGFPRRVARLGPSGGSLSEHTAWSATDPTRRPARRDRARSTGPLRRPLRSWWRPARSPSPPGSGRRAARARPRPPVRQVSRARRARRRTARRAPRRAPGPTQREDYHDPDDDQDDDSHTGSGWDFGILDRGRLGDRVAAGDLVAGHGVGLRRLGWSGSPGPAPGVGAVRPISASGVGSATTQPTTGDRDLHPGPGLAVGHDVRPGGDRATVRSRRHPEPGHHAGRDAQIAGDHGETGWRTVPGWRCDRW